MFSTITFEAMEYISSYTLAMNSNCWRKIRLIFLLILPIKIQKYSFGSLLNLKTIISASLVFLIGNFALVIISILCFFVSNISSRSDILKKNILFFKANFSIGTFLRIINY